MAGKTTVKNSTKASGTAAKATVRKTDVNKTTADKKPTVKRATRKKTQEVYIQYWGKEYNTSDIVERVKTVWTRELKRKASELKDMKVYIKPDENKVYYVFNEDVNGCIDL